MIFVLHRPLRFTSTLVHDPACCHSGTVAFLPAASCSMSIRSTLHAPSSILGTARTSPKSPAPQSELTHWPVQIRLAPVNAPYFNGADLLIAADCTAYAYGDFHQRFMKDHVTLIGCPKLDPVDYSEKLSDILRHNDIRSLTIVRMEVPCCGGIERAATAALDASGKHLPCQVVTIGMNGRIKE